MNFYLPTPAFQEDSNKNKEPHGNAALVKNLSIL